MVAGVKYPDTAIVREASILVALDDPTAWGLLLQKPQREWRHR